MRLVVLRVVTGRTLNFHLIGQHILTSQNHLKTEKKTAEITVFQTKLFYKNQ